MTAARLIDEADGLASLGLYGDAWEVLESLPPADRRRPAVLNRVASLAGPRQGRGGLPWVPGKSQAKLLFGLEAHRADRNQSISKNRWLKIEASMSALAAASYLDRETTRQEGLEINFNANNPMRSRENVGPDSGTR